MNKPKNTSPKTSLLKSAIIISLGGLIVKVLGAFYRIPLNNFLKAEGLGIYQAAFPVYLILMTFTGSAATTTITKAISAGEKGERVLKKSLAVIVPTGIFGWLIMSLLAKPLSTMQGTPNAAAAYIALAPSLIFVSAISCFRGYFQGKNDMRPTAISQIIEQIVKLAVGTSLCFFFGNPPAKGASLACFAVSAGELSATVYLVFLYKNKRDFIADDRGKYTFKRLIAGLIPVTLTTSVIPLSRLFDSFTVVNFMSGYTNNATGLYGLYSGSVESIIGMPVALCYGLSAAAIPAISSYFSKKDYENAKRNSVKALSYTLFLSAVSFACIALFSEIVVNILFPKLTDDNKTILNRLIDFAAIDIVLLSLIQTESSVLIAIDKPFLPSVSLFIGFTIKATAQLLLLKNPELNIFAVLYSDILCYLVAVFLNLVYIIYRFKKRKPNDETYTCGRGSEGRRPLFESLRRDKESR